MLLSLFAGTRLKPTDKREKERNSLPFSDENEANSCVSLEYYRFCGLGADVISGGVREDRGTWFAIIIYLFESSV